MANGALELDLSLAELTFPDLKDHGDVHIQVLSIGSAAHAALPSYRPQWVFCLQPWGLEVSGPVGVSMDLPAYENDYGYLDYYGECVVLVGLYPDALMIVPVGVGLVDADARLITSEGDVHLQRLAYIGYALMSQAEEIQSILEQYGASETSTYEYDNLDRLIHYAISGGDITETTCTYQGYNRDTEVVTENGVETKSRTCIYDETDWLILITDDTEGKNTYTNFYDYDENGNTIKKIDESLPNPEMTFVYNARNCWWRPGAASSGPKSSWGATTTTHRA